jgi:hypothetical protein
MMMWWLVGLSLAAEAPASPPVDPAGPGAVAVRFETDEGTWMNLDVSPDGRAVVFDLLGHVYVVPLAGGRRRA